MTWTNDLKWRTPVLTFALLNVSVEIEAALMGGAVNEPITLAPAVISAVVLGSPKSSHVVQGSHDQLMNTSDVDNREHLAMHPVQMHHDAIGSIDPLGPLRWQRLHRPQR